MDEKKPKGRKFTVWIVMTIVIVGYVAGCAFKDSLLQADMNTIIIIYVLASTGYMGINVWNKKQVGQFFDQAVKK